MKKIGVFMSCLVAFPSLAADILSLDDALRDEGWTVYRQSDKDTYSRYRAEITEQAAHSVTPTTNVKSKVNAKTEF